MWLLGTPYPMDSLQNEAVVMQPLIAHFRSLLWFTYRFGFDPEDIPPHESDAGWGCMMRSGQMLLGQVLMILLTPEKRAWRLTHDDQANPSSTHRQVVRLFDDSVDSPYSLPCIALEGLKNHEMQLGEWYGPTTMSYIIKDLVSKHQPHTLQVLVCSESTIYLDQAKLTARVGDKWIPLLLLVPLRLGLGNLNPLYKPALLRSFAIPASVGVIGGKPSASFYFVGAQDEDLLYLDPHTVQNTVSMRGTFSTKSFHCSKIRQMKVDDLDPCLTVAFLCEDEAEFDDLCSQLSEIEDKLGRDGRSIISVQATSPTYDEDAILSMMASDEEEGDDGFVLM